MSDQAFSDAPVNGASATPPVKSAARWEDFIDIFYAPASVFQRRINSGFAIPMIVVTILIGAIFFANKGVMQPVMDGEFSRATAAAMKKNPNLTAEQMNQFRGMGEKFGAIFLIVGLPVTMFVVGLISWFIGKIFDAKQTLGDAIMVASFAYVPKIVESIVNGVQGLLLDPANLTSHYQLTLGVGRFLDPDTSSPMMLAILGRVDLFTLWVTLLIAIGLSVTGKIPRSKAYIAAALVWVVGAIPPVLGALRQ